MNEYKYIIPGKPIPLARPRFSKGRVYDPQEEEKNEVWMYIRRQQNGPMLMGPVHFEIKFFMKKPKKWKGNVWHSNKPDLSNLIKFYEDIGTGILYYDDKQISKISAEKVYGDEERTEITIREIA